MRRSYRIMLTPHNAQLYLSWEVGGQHDVINNVLGSLAKDHRGWYDFASWIMFCPRRGWTLASVSRYVARINCVLAYQAGKSGNPLSCGAAQVERAT